MEGRKYICGACDKACDMDDVNVLYRITNDDENYLHDVYVIDCVVCQACRDLKLDVVNTVSNDSNDINDINVNKIHTFNAKMCFHNAEFSERVPWLLFHYIANDYHRMVTETASESYDVINDTYSVKVRNERRSNLWYIMDVVNSVTNRVMDPGDMPADEHAKLAAHYQRFKNKHATYYIDESAREFEDPRIYLAMLTSCISCEYISEDLDVGMSWLFRFIEDDVTLRNHMYQLQKKGVNVTIDTIRDIINVDERYYVGAIKYYRDILQFMTDDDKSKLSKFVEDGSQLKDFKFKGVDGKARQFTRFEANEATDIEFDVVQYWLSFMRGFRYDNPALKINHQYATDICKVYVKFLFENTEFYRPSGSDVADDVMQKLDGCTNLSAMYDLVNVESFAKDVRIVYRVVYPELRYNIVNPISAVAFLRDVIQKYVIMRIKTGIHVA